MRPLILGAGGQLGQCLAETLPEAVCATRAQVDVTDEDALRTAIESADADVVINAAAYTAVDDAETDAGTAYAVNAAAPRTISNLCREHDLPFVHISTDYVFGYDQSRTDPYVETDLPGPLGCYGISKLGGEWFIKSAWKKHYILRTCGLYGPVKTPGWGNIVETFLRLAKEQGKLRVVDDQYCTPTAACDLAGTIAKLITTEAYGLYHATNSGQASWFEFATELVKIANLDVPVEPVSSTEFPRPARRPGYSVLNCDKLARLLGEPMRHWSEALADHWKLRG